MSMCHTRARFSYSYYARHAAGRAQPRAKVTRSEEGHVAAGRRGRGGAYQDQPRPHHAVQLYCSRINQAQYESILDLLA